MRRDDADGGRSGFTPNGFTLVELMVSLVIFSMLSAAGVALLSFSVRAQGAANERLDEVAQLRRLNALLTADLAQALPRPYRDSAGATRAAFTGGTGTPVSSGDGSIALGMVRGGWSNPDLLPRASMQRVEYRVAAGRLERIAYPHVDGSQPLPPAVLLTGVRSIALRYRSAGDWRQVWDAERPDALPQAVELVAEVEALGTVRQLFVVGVGFDPPVQAPAASPPAAPAPAAPPAPAPQP